MWTSRVQSLTAQSTNEAEFFPLAQSVKKLSWIWETSRAFVCFITDAVKLYEDNLGSIAWTFDLQGLKKTKHKRICYYYVRDAVDAGTVDVVLVPTPSAGNRVDRLTKMLAKLSFVKFRADVRVVDRTSVDRRAVEKAC